MSRSAPGDRARDTYHHGDLRRALLEAALLLLEERGLDALTLRALARQAGVSHTAPYHHFPDKAALLAAVVETGFGQLSDALLAAGGPPRAGHNLARLQAIGVAYVHFAVARPALFRLLCRPELSSADASGEARPGDAAARRAGEAAYAVLTDAVGACLASGEIEGQPEALALAAWCIVHGLATLVLDGPLRRSAAPAAAATATATATATVDDLAQRVTDVLARGLAPRP